MKASLVLCALACFVGTFAQNSTESPSQGSNPYPLPDMGEASGVIGQVLASVQYQQFMSQRYGNLLLNYQYAIGWMQVAGGYQEMAVREAKGEAPAGSLEQDEDSEQDLHKAASLEEFVPGAAATSPALSYDDVERNTEQTLLFVLKIMYLQAANKLSNAHQSHYQSKIQLSMLSGLSAGNPGVSSVLYMMYYLEVLRVMSSAITIQRQDAWNTWLLFEIMETNQFDNSRREVPDKFSAAMASARAVAGQIWYMETMLDVQMVFLEYYIQMIIANLSYQAMQAGAPQQAPQQFNAFVEEESMAEPSKPFFPFPGAGAPQYLAYYSYILKFWGVMLHMYAASGFAMSSMPPAENQPAPAPETRHAWVQPMQQWAWIKITEATLDMYTLYAMMYAPHGANANAAAAVNLVQTDAPVTNAAPTQ